jgi:hypothetical protein
MRTSADLVTQLQRVMSGRESTRTPAVTVTQRYAIHLAYSLSLAINDMDKHIVRKRLVYKVLPEESEGNRFSGLRPTGRNLIADQPHFVVPRVIYLTESGPVG